MDVFSAKLSVFSTNQTGVHMVYVGFTLVLHWFYIGFTLLHSALKTAPSDMARCFSLAIIENYSGI